MKTVRSTGIPVGAFAILLIASSPSQAQRSVPLSTPDATLVVAGTVKAVFARQTGGAESNLVQISVRQVEVIGNGQRGARYPAPGESAFVLVVPSSGRGRLFNRGARTTLPAEGVEIRAFLKADADGDWQAASDDWYQPLDSTRRSSEQADAGPGREAGRRGSALGMDFEVIELRGRLALRVSQLQADGAGRSAGLEVGDVIIGVNGQGIESLDELRQRVEAVDELELAVIDVNSGRIAQVTVPNDRGPSVNRPPSDRRTNERPLSPRGTANPSLGISAERVSLGLRSALKVTSVEPDSPAAVAGLEVGDVLVKANGVPLTEPEQLVSALRKSDGILTLAVRDVRTGREVSVEVNLMGDADEPRRAPRQPRRSATPTGRMGVVTELAFYDVEAAIKVTEVVPGSPAARAGLSPGVVILEANGQKLLHPNDLAEVEREGGRIALSVVDPGSGRQQRVTVDLGR